MVYIIKNSFGIIFYPGKASQNLPNKGVTTLRTAPILHKRHNIPHTPLILQLFDVSVL